MLFVERIGALKSDLQDGAQAIDGNPETAAVAVAKEGNWLSVRTNRGAMPPTVTVVVFPGANDQCLAGGFELWRGGAWGDIRSQYAYRCSGPHALAVPPTAGPFSFPCSSEHGGDYIMLKLVGWARTLSIAELEIYTLAPPSLPPLPPPPSPPPVPPTPPPGWPSPPYPPSPPHHPPIQALSDWSGGFATRYWDCCKPSCSWPQNHHVFGDPQTPFCDRTGVTQILRRYEHSGCEAGLAWQGYTCFDQAPWRDDVDNTLSYGFVASSRQFAGCNRCFELDFGSSAGHFSPGDRGSRELAARGKRMIVQATNIGADVEETQFDLMIPGGGVGLFGTGCHSQWELASRPNVDIGLQYGGFLSRCQGCAEPGSGCVPDWRISHEELKTCVRSMCDEVFGLSELQRLREACHWYVDWFEVADKPTFQYREVNCPRTSSQM